jgi:hypothetical protein
VEEHKADRLLDLRIATDADSAAAACGSAPGSGSASLAATAECTTSWSGPDTGSTVSCECTVP